MESKMRFMSVGRLKNRQWRHVSSLWLVMVWEGRFRRSSIYLWEPWRSTSSSRRTSLRQALATVPALLFARWGTFIPHLSCWEGGLHECPRPCSAWLSAPRPLPPLLRSAVWGPRSAALALSSLHFCGFSFPPSNLSSELCHSAPVSAACQT